MKIKPLADHIVLEIIETKTMSGLIIPEGTEKEKPEQARVVAVGSGKVSEEGKRIPPEVKKGDIVLFKKYGPDEVKVDGKEYLIAKEEDILAVIEQN
jgi:chaperonin GroES